jgi:hypothetical protein
MKIAIDIDSTLHHYWDQFSAIAARRFGVSLPYENQRDWGIGALRPEQLAVVVGETHAPANILTAIPYEGSVDALRTWSQEGHWIHITSHRADEAYGATSEWLSSVGFAHDDLHCSFDKISRCVELEIDVLIDDSPVNIARALDAGITPATISHPWNEEICLEEGVICASDWPTLTEKLEPVLVAARLA